MNRTLAFFLSLLLLFAGGTILWVAAKMNNRADNEYDDSAHIDAVEFPSVGEKIEDFRLTERSGDTFDSRELAGKVWVSSFFFASCPSTCRRQNDIIRGIHDEFSSQGVRFVSITCDPENDTPEKLQQYANLYTSDPDSWLFLTGELEDIERVGADSFGLSVGPQTHSDRLVVADQTGVVRGIYDWHQPEQLDGMKAMLSQLLKESPAPGENATAADSHPGVGVDWITDFTLTERSGKTFDSRDLDGQVWVVSFFFSICPTSCRTQNELIDRLHEQYGPKGVKFVSITCDPETDTPKKLREYARLFDADDEDWLFLTGDLNYIRRIGGERFEVHVDKGVHMDNLIVVDKWGKVRGKYNWHDSLKVEELKRTMDALLVETEPPNAEAGKRGEQAGEQRASEQRASEELSEERASEERASEERASERQDAKGQGGDPLDGAPLEKAS